MAEITALGATLLHSLWQATALALLLWSVSRYGKLTAAGRYRVAYGTLLLQVVLSVGTFLQYYTPAPRLESTVKQVVIAYMGYLPASAPTYNRFTDPDFWMTSLVVCWLAAMLVGSGRLAVSFWRVRGMLGAQSVQRLQASDTYTRLELRVTELAQRLGLRGRLRVRIGRNITTPMLVGHLKPVLVFPLALVNQLSTEEAETVILHELAHLRRYDHYFNLLQCLIEVLYYYHPAVHWIGARVREEREYCCDDLVLHYGPGKLPYARALLHYGEQAVGQPATALSLTDGGGLLTRVRRFLHHQEMKYTMNYRLLLLPLLALFCLIATAAYAPQLAAEGEDDSLTVVSLAPALPALDTLPPGEHEVTKISNGKVTKLRVKDRQIEELEIDGRVVPKAEFKENEPLAEELLGVRPHSNFRTEPEGWYFDFSPDSLRRLSARALTSVSMDSIMELTQLRAQSMQLSADSLQRIAQSLALVDIDSTLNEVRAWSFANDSILNRPFEFNPSGMAFDFDSLGRIYMRESERLNLDSLQWQAELNGLSSLELDSIDISWGSDSLAYPTLRRFKSGFELWPLRRLDDLPSLEREERRLKEQLRQLEERKAELKEQGQ